MILADKTKIRNYQIVSKIGEGGMGEVYLAEEEDLGRQVAIKLLAPEFTRDPKLVERFKQEARVQASLIHSNIVTLYTFFKEDNNYFMIMEYAEGVTLKELISKTGPIPEDRAVKIFNQILDGLEFAHSRSIVHRDIKPANIMISSTDNVKIMDFGIAKILGDMGMTKTGTKMGTIYYMSPEQVRADKEIDQRSDIYSLGVTFYQMLSGQLPYDTTTLSEFEIMEQIVRKELEDPRKVYPYISENSVKVMFGMLVKDKNQRFQSIQECKSKLNGVALNNISTNQVSSTEGKNLSEGGKNISKKTNRKMNDKGGADFINQLLGLNYTKLKKIDKIRLEKIDYSLTSIDFIKWLFKNLSIRKVTLNNEFNSAITGHFNGEIKVWDIKTKKELKSFSYHKNKINDLALIDNDNIISADASGIINIFNIQNDTLKHTLASSKSPVSNLAIHPGKKMFASVSIKDRISFWSISKGQEVIYIPLENSDENSIAFSDNGKHFITFPDESKIKFYTLENLLTNKNISRYLDKSGQQISFLRFSPFYEIIFAGHKSGRLMIMDYSGQTLFQTNKHKKKILLVDHLSDQKDVMLSASSDGEIYFWKVIEGNNNPEQIEYI